MASGCQQKEKRSEETVEVIKTKNPNISSQSERHLETGRYYSPNSHVCCVERCL